MTPHTQSPIGASAEDGGIARCQPAPGFELQRRWPLASSRDLAALRGELAEALAEHGEGGGELPDTPAKLALIATELATNALKHGLPPTIVCLLRREDLWLIDVADHDLRQGPVYAGVRVAGKGGLGMHLARELSADVGWYTTEDTKHVWATFPTSGD